MALSPRALAFAAGFGSIPGPAIRVHRRRLRLSAPPWVPAGPAPGGPAEGVATWSRSRGPVEGVAAWSRSHALPLGLASAFWPQAGSCPLPSCRKRRIPVRLLQVIDARHVRAGSLLFTRTPQYVRSKNLGRIKFVCKLPLFGVTTCCASVATWTWLGWGGGAGPAGGTPRGTWGGSGRRSPGTRNLTGGPRLGKRFL